MIERYTPPKIGNIWTEQEKFSRFMEIEILLCEALEKQKKIPQGVSAVIRKKARISLPEIKKIEASTHHDIIAFLKNLSEPLGKYAQYLHWGLTSNDLNDTTLAWQLRDVTLLILKDLDVLIKAVKKKALKYKDTLCMGRSHGVHAELYSFGLKFAYFYQDLVNEHRLIKESLSFVAAGKISGAVGTFAHIDPAVEKYICKKIGISAAVVSTQIVSRERFAYYLSLLALTAATVERFATEIRHLHRTEVQEAQEPFFKGQKGSSAMPHKQNPIICERMSGLARLIRGNMSVAYENVNLWHERDISHSAAERVIIPDSTAALDYMLLKMTEVVKYLKVNPKQMLKNIELNRGMVYSQKILLNLMQKGIPRIKAYDMVQSVALDVINNKTDFKTEMLADKTIAEYLSSQELEKMFDPMAYLRNIDKIYKKAGLL